MLDGTSLATLPDRRLWRSLLAILIFTLTALRLVYLSMDCPLDLAQDEAHYWDWSRQLDWSYYSKGPLVAWLIRASLELFGPLSISISGHEVVAVRLPAVLCGSLLLLALYVLTVQTTGSDSFAFFVALICAIMPVFSAASLLITIDSPFVCCWAWALVCGHRAIFQGDRWAWALAGFFLGLGILAKYTMLLWLFSLGLFLWFNPAYRSLLYTRNFWLMVGIAFICSLPIIGWNAAHEWVSFRHVAGQAGLPTEGRQPSVRWLGPVEFIGGQCLLLVGWWFISWVCAMIAFRPARSSDPNVRFLWWMSWPTLAVFGVASFRSGGQLNWPVAAYVSGSVLTAAWLLNAMRSKTTWFRNLAKTNVIVGSTVSLGLTLLIHDSSSFRPLLASLGKRFKPSDPYAGRTLDPTCRLRGWKMLGHEVDEVRRECLAQDGVDPVIAALNWNMPGELGFYCDGHPHVYSLGAFIGERVNQYDLWRPNPAADPQVFADRTFVVVNGHEETLRSIFAEARLVRIPTYREGDYPIASWTVWVCRGYHGNEAIRAARQMEY